MSATLVILLIGGLFFASLLAVVLQGQFRRKHVWARFADTHGLSHHSDETTRRIEGRWEGRPFVARARRIDGDCAEMFVEVPVRDVDLRGTSIRRSTEPSEDRHASNEEDEYLEVDDPLGSGRLRLEVRGGPSAAALSSGGAFERLVELQAAEPRIEWRDDRLVYAVRGVLLDRRRLAELVDRMVESARHLEGL